MGGLDWWLDNLSTKETILRRHYSPTGFLYLCNTTTRLLMQELINCLKSLASLPFDNSLPWKHDALKMPPPATSPVKTAAPILKNSPTRAKMQRPLSYVQSSSKPNAKPLYRRTQSQHSGLSPKTSPTHDKQEPKAEEFSSLKQKWESLCKERKVDLATAAHKNTANTANTAATA